jgi:hypothetical protein
MQPSAPGAEETVIGDFLGQGMLERVLQVGKDALLVDKFQVFQLTEAVIELRLHVRNALQQACRELPPNYRRSLHDVFVVLW